MTATTELASLLVRERERTLQQAVLARAAARARRCLDQSLRGRAARALGLRTAAC